MCSVLVVLRREIENKQIEDAAVWGWEDGGKRSIAGGWQWRVTRIVNETAKQKPSQHQPPATKSLRPLLSDKLAFRVSQQNFTEKWFNNAQTIHVESGEGEMS